LTFFQCNNGNKNRNSMSAIQKGQQVCTPDGGGLVEEIIGEKIVVKLDNGETKTFAEEEITDDSSAG
jgi:preprotein translocase subunit YajC